jgi:hypothetical protein
MKNNLFAAGLISSDTNFKTLVDDIVTIFNSLIPLLVGAAVVIFLYGVFVFIVKSSAGNADGRKEGINLMIFGIIGIAVMVSTWGLIAFVTHSLDSSISNRIPHLKTN